MTLFFPYEDRIEDFLPCTGKYHCMVKENPMKSLNNNVNLQKKTKETVSYP